MPIIKVVHITIAWQFDLCVYFIVIVGEYPRSTSGFVSSETSGRERSLPPCPSEPGRGGRGSHGPPHYKARRCCSSAKAPFLTASEELPSSRFSSSLFLFRSRWTSVSSCTDFATIACFFLE